MDAILFIVILVVIVVSQTPFEFWWHLWSYLAALAGIHLVTGPDKVANAILSYNNTLAEFLEAPIYTVEARGVIMHKIDAIAAQGVATEIEKYATGALTFSYVMGSMAIESAFDAACQNGNLGPGESNTANNPGGYDMGACQFKLEYLVGGVANASTVDEARVFALDVTKAIPHFCEVLEGDLDWAKSIIAKNTSSAPDPRMNNPYVLAANSYNYGRSGALNLYQSGQWPTHGQHVIDLTNMFAKEIGDVSVFADLAA